MNPILPRRVKTSELAIINPVWIDILANPEEFTQIKEIEAFQDVVFLWVLREDGKVIVGIEEPWRFPEAFDPSLKDPLEKMKEYFEENKKFFEKDGSGGHPTLAAWFADDGRSSCYAGAAYIGGELKFNKSSGKWELSNKSGRFGRIDEIIAKTVTLEEVIEKMTEAADIIEKSIGLDVTLDIYPK